MQQVSPEPPVYLVELLFSFKGIKRVEVPEESIHVLFEPGWRPGPVLFSFATADLPAIEIKPGQMYLTPERQMMTIRQFENALDRHRQEALAYLETLGDEDLQRKARVPRFKRFLGTDEVTMPMWVEVLFASHWGDHADQLAKIRKAVGLPEGTAGDGNLAVIEGGPSGTRWGWEWHLT